MFIHKAETYKSDEARWEVQIKQGNLERPQNIDSFYKSYQISYKKYNRYNYRKYFTGVRRMFINAAI